MMEKTTFEITPTRQTSIRKMIQELWAYREIVVAFAERSFRLKYKQAVFGVLWAVIQPLAFLLIFVLAFGRLVPVNDGETYAAVALAALVPWQFISSAVSEGSNSLLQQAAILRKVYFPRHAPVLGAILSTLPQLLIGLVLLLLFAPIVGADLGINTFYVIPLSLLACLPALAASLPAAALNVYYRDVRLVLPMAIQFWFFASPVAYTAAVVNSPWRELYALFNPAVGILDSFRRAYASNLAPDWELLGLSLLGAAVYLFIGLFIFEKLEADMAEVV